jgi:hypothetical protein
LFVRGGGGGGSGLGSTFFTGEMVVMGLPAMLAFHL